MSKEKPNFIAELENEDPIIDDIIEFNERIWRDESLICLIQKLYSVATKLYGSCGNSLSQKERRKIDHELDVIEYLIRQYV